MQTPSSLSIFRYSSHLDFLQDAYDFLHSRDESFSYDRIAAECGLKSRTEARSLIKGAKKATEAQLLALAACLGLRDEDERKYLLCLARFHDSGASPAAYELFHKLMALQKSRLPAANPFREIEIATSLLHMTLLSALDLEGADQAPEALSRLLKGRYSAGEIGAAIAELEAHGYVARAGDGRWRLLQKHVRKYDYNSNFFMKGFHSRCLDAAREALESEAPSERYLVGASFCINGKVFQRIVQKMNAFAENLMQLEGMAGEPDTVVQFNQQLIKMTSTNEHERGLGLTKAERELGDETENTVIA